MPARSIVHAYLRTVRELDPNVRLLLASQGLAAAYTGGIWGVLGNLYLLRLGHGTEFIGLVNAVLIFGTAISSLPSGTLGDRFTARRVMIVGLTAYAFASGMLGMTWLLPPGLVAPVVLGAALLVGISNGTVGASLGPLLMRFVDDGERGYAFSLYSAVGIASAFVAALISGSLPRLLSSIFGAAVRGPGAYGFSLLLGTLLIVPAVRLVTSLREPRRSPEPSGNEPDPEHERHRGPVPFNLLLPVSLVMVVCWLGLGGVAVFWNVYLDQSLHVGTPAIGTISAVTQLLAVPAALAGPVLMSRFGRCRTYTVALLGVAMSMVALAWAPGVFVATLALTARSAFFSISSPTFAAVSQSLVPMRWRGTMSGAIGMAYSVGWGVVALSGGYIIAAVGFRVLFLGGSLLVAAAAAIFWFWVGRAAVRAESAEVAPAA